MSDRALIAGVFVIATTLTSAAFAQSDETFDASSVNTPARTDANGLVSDDAPGAEPASSSVAAKRKADLGAAMAAEEADRNTGNTPLAGDIDDEARAVDSGDDEDSDNNDDSGYTGDDEAADEAAANARGDDAADDDNADVNAEDLPDASSSDYGADDFRAPDNAEIKAAADKARAEKAAAEANSASDDGAIGSNTDMPERERVGEHLQESAEDNTYTPIADEPIDEEMNTGDESAAAADRKARAAEMESAGAPSEPPAN